MSRNAEERAQSQRLMENLGRLVDGNHARADELRSTSLQGDSYFIHASVLWRFEHDARSRTVHGDGAVEKHFGFDQAKFQAHLDALGRDAASNREIRVGFMTSTTAAAAQSLSHSGKAQIIREYAPCSVCHRCGNCGGSGQVDCSGCHGSGRRSCSSCGGSGRRMVSVHRARWHGGKHEMQLVQEQETCSGCHGSGHQVCSSCGGSGRQRCASCSGHGYFTDIVDTWALARPQWQVRSDSGLADDLLQDFMLERGPEQALELAPSLNLLDTGYDDEDRWVAHYRGEANVIEQGIALRDQSWCVLAVGPHPVPIQTAPVFDYLLADELAHVRHWRRTRKQVAVRSRAARQFFHTCRKLPALDQATQAVAARANAKQPATAVSDAVQGFISTKAAVDFGSAIQAMLHKVSPPYSVLAWGLAMAAPIGWVVVDTAIGVPHISGWFDAVLTLAGKLLGGGLGVLLMSPLAWLLSALVSGAFRLRVPKPYRQKGRNWAPLRPALWAVPLAILPGLLYGLSVRYLDMPPVDPVVRAVSAWAGQIRPAPPARVVSPQLPMDTASTYRAIQHYLNRHGYPVGSEDGHPGPRTQAQIQRYLNRHHLSNTLTPAAIWADMQQRP